MGRLVLCTLIASCGLACSAGSEPPAPTAGSGGGSNAAVGSSSSAVGTSASTGSGGASGSTGSGTGPGGSPIDAAGVDRSEPDADPGPEGGSGGAGPIGSDARDSTSPAVDATAGDAVATTDAPSAPCPAGSLLCEDFDKYASAADLAPDWRVTASGATLAVDATKPFRAGGKALHVVANATTPTAVMLKEGAPLFPISGNVMYGRVMMWLTQTPAGNYHWNNIQAAGTIPTSMRYGKYGWGGQNGKILAGYTVRDTPTGAAVIDCSKPSAMAILEKRWVCVEWKFDGVGNEMHLWFDGTLLADVDVIGTGTRCLNNVGLGSTWSAPTFANLSIGWQQYQASTGGLEFWMDDLAVSTQRVGCPAP